MNAAREVPPETGRGIGPSILLSAAWWAVLGGVIEASVHAFRWYFLGEVVKLHSHYFWMAPLGNLIVFAPVALFLWGAHRLMPDFLTRARAAGMFAFLATLGVMLMFESLHRVAMVLLAVGVAVQATRTIAAQPLSAARMMRPTLGWLAACVAVLGIALGLGRDLRERRILAGLQEAPAGAQNVVLLILDTVRAANLGLYGYDRPTSPNLDALAPEGITFERAISTSPWTLPSHTTMFTGHYAHEVTSNWETPLNDAFPTVAEILTAQGWATGGFIANIFYADRPYGLARGFAHYEDYRLSLGEILNASTLASFVFAGRPGFTFNALRRMIDYHVPFGFKDAHRVNDEFLDWLDDRPGDQPFFAFLNYLDAHYPYVSPADLRETFDVQERWTYNVNAYDAAIASLDRALGELVAALRQRNLSDNTVIIVTADHGEHLGEKGRTSHGNSLYMEALHIPLVIVDPDGPRGRRVEPFVTLRSLAATILDLAGAADPAVVPGTSLRAAWLAPAETQPSRNATALADPTAAGMAGSDTGDPLLASVRQSVRTNQDLPVFHGDLHSIIVDGLQFIHNGDGTEELYDLLADYEQERDLIASDSLRTVLSRLRSRAIEMMPGIQSDANRD